MSVVSIREVANRAGVSRATVSRVLNFDTAALVAEPTRERVRRAAVELGYHPNAVARGLAGKPMNTVGVVMAYDLPSVTSDPFLGPVLDGILETNKRRHQKTVIFTEDDWNSANRNVPIYCDGHCDGLLLIAPRTDSAIVRSMKAARRPFVLVGDSREDEDVTVADVDNVGMATALTEHLIARGRRRIAILCGNNELTSNGQRLRGYALALAAAGLSLEADLVVAGEYWEWSGYQNTALLLERPPGSRPDALFCSNGRIAVGALRAVRDHGMDPVTEILIAACCESEDDGLAPPSVSAIYMPVRRVGIAAVDALLVQIHEDEPAGSRTIVPAHQVALANAIGGVGPVESPANVEEDDKNQGERG